MFETTEGLAVYAHHERMDPGFMRLTALLSPDGIPTAAANVARRVVSAGSRDAAAVEARHGRITHLATCDLSLRPWTFTIFAMTADQGLAPTGMTRPVSSWKASTSAMALGLPRKLAPRAVRASPGADWINAITYSDIGGKAWALWPELLPDNTAVHLYSTTTLERLSGTTRTPFTREPCAPEIDGVPLSQVGRK
jgi:hypothetical protein